MARRAPAGVACRARVAIGALPPRAWGMGSGVGARGDAAAGRSAFSTGRPSRIRADSGNAQGRARTCCSPHHIVFCYFACARSHQAHAVVSAMPSTRGAPSPSTGSAAAQIPPARPGMDGQWKNVEVRGSTFHRCPAFRDGCCAPCPTTAPAAPAAQCYWEIQPFYYEAWAPHQHQNIYLLPDE